MSPKSLAGSLALAGTTLLFATATILLFPIAAQAERTSQLQGQPGIRHKQLMRFHRFELAPTMEMTVAAEYKHTLALGVKAEYHLTDSLAFGVMLFPGFAFDTGLGSKIRTALVGESGEDVDPTPSQSQYDTHLNTIPLHGAVHATVTPWIGKMALFGKAYLNFDVYFQGGLAFAQTENSWKGAPGVDEDEKSIFCPNAKAEEKCFKDPRNDNPQNDGFNPGLLLGGGIHTYVGRWLAVDLSFRDYMFSDNPSGLDYDANRKVDKGDRRFLNHFFFGIGVSILLPTRVTISR
ncbi:MAG: hypothetical protein V2A73_09405 [Pseudomonadota bacterium]